MSIIVRNVSKTFYSKDCNVQALEKVDFQVNKGELICVLGPSGCGKSTLLNIIAGLEKPSEGTVTLNGKEIEGAGPDRLVIFQELALFPWLRVIENVEFGMKMNNIPKHERRVRALEYLKMVHLEKFQNVYIHQLSGGMKQRVALARALALDSEVLLMDESLASLDNQTKNSILQEIQQIWMITRKTIIFVTHCLEEALILADRIIVISGSPGRIKGEICIELERPRIMREIDPAYFKDIIDNLVNEVGTGERSEYDCSLDL
ncbi:MAG: ABC transporter ATP-binding protein [Clostridia bacterium]